MHLLAVSIVRPHRTIPYPAPGLSEWVVAHTRLAGWRVLAAAILFLGAVLVKSHAMPAAAAGTIESGAPAFSIMTRGELGLAAQPTDIHNLPDGRVLVVAGRELALGDGARWSTFTRNRTDRLIPTTTVAISRDGTIYAGIPGGFGRVVFDDTGRWMLVREASLPGSESSQTQIPRQVHMVDNSWYWHSGSGEITEWQPGHDPVSVGSTGAIEHIFAWHGRHYVTDRANGLILEKDHERFVPLSTGSSTTASLTVTSTLPIGDDQLLVGTQSGGLMLFDGTALHRWSARSPLMGEHRINDVCRVSDTFFAAAVDGVGLVFFEHDGRVRQIVGRDLDNRLGRIRKIILGPEGGIWGLLNDGIVRVEPPSRFSAFDLLIGSSINTAFPVRHQGRLWLLADGTALRGVYDRDDHLERLEPDTPPGCFVFSLSVQGGVLAAGTEAGLFLHTDAGWRCVAPELINLRIIDPEPKDGRWLYGARGEVGWISMTDDAVSAQRFPVAGLRDIYGGEIGRDGVPWVELGAGRLGRIVIGRETLKLDLFTTEHGLPNAWAQVFELDGVVRFNIAETIYAFDPATRRFTPDTTLQRRVPGLHAVMGRPRRDALGRLWIAGNGSLLIVDDRGGTARVVEETIPLGLSPIYFTCEDGGVVWLHDQRRLLRYDPSMPTAKPPRLDALITHVTLPESGRIVFPTAGRLEPLSHRDGSLVINFVAPGDPIGTPAAFEIRLAGADESWTPAAPGGTAAFSRLREGDYTFMVRARSGPWMGGEATLAFTIDPPWFRTPVAYGSYALGGLTLLFSTAAAWSYLARRERQRLEWLVGQRTAELKRSEESYRQLSEELEQRVRGRTEELNQANLQLQTSNLELEATNRELESFSYSVSHDLRAPLRGIDGWSLALMEDYAEKLDGTAVDYIARVRRESQRLGVIIDELLKLSRTTRAELRLEPLDISAIATATATRVAQTRPATSVTFVCQPGLRASGDPALIEAALFNLLDNAWKFTTRTAQPRVEVGRADTERGAAFFVRDNGAGFEMRHARKLFGAFQRMHTQEEFPGTGVGLATVQRIIHRHRGAVWAHSEPGLETTFYFTLPRVPGDSVG